MEYIIKNSECSECGTPDIEVAVYPCEKTGRLMVDHGLCNGCGRIIIMSQDLLQDHIRSGFIVRRY